MSTPESYSITNMIIDHDSHIPLHIQVESILRQLIQKEEYQNGKLLPSEQDLSKKLGISRNTFRAAMNKLVYEGLVERKKGIGTKVNHNTVHTQLNAWTSFTKEMNAKGRPFSDIDKKVSLVKAPQEVASYLGIEENTLIQKLERLRGEQKKPIVLFTSYFHPRIGISNDETFDGPLYKLLEDKYQVVTVVAKEEITAQIPDEKLKEQLDIEDNTPVLIRKHLACDSSEHPIEFCYASYRADKFVYQINFEHRNNDD